MSEGKRLSVAKMDTLGTELVLNRESIMKQHTAIVLVAAMLPGVAAAQETGKYQCTYGDIQRRVEIAHEPGVEVPCSVHYYKDTENPGEQQVLWSANSDASYCDAKATEFVGKLEGMGWDCGVDNDAAVEEEVIEENEVEESDELLGDSAGPENPDLPQ
jgi:hypothetical protein